nr:DUF4245 domain-containing protein [Herbiconiux sp. VKM Ac-2851]
MRNLLYALLVSVGLVAAIIFLVPRPEESLLESVDYQDVAASAQASMPVPLAAPELPEGWTSNAAEVRSGTADGVLSWYVGLITPQKQYIGLTQAIDANPTWLADQVGRGLASGTVSLDGVDWTVYDNRDRAGSSDEVGNAEYALTTESGATTYVVFGTADPDEIEQVAAALAANVQEQPAEATR